MTKGILDYMKTAPAAAPEELESAEFSEMRQEYTPQAERAAAAKARLAAMVEENSPLYELILAAFEEVGKLAGDPSWTEKQCSIIKSWWTVAHIRQLDIFSYHLDAQELEQKEQKLLGQLDKKAAECRKILDKLESIKSAVALTAGEDSTETE